MVKHTGSPHITKNQPPRTAFGDPLIADGGKWTFRVLGSGLFWTLIMEQEDSHPRNGSCISLFANKRKNKRKTKGTLEEVEPQPYQRTRGQEFTFGKTALEIEVRLPSE